MVKPVATWFITAALFLVNTSAQFIGEYSLSTASHRVRALVASRSLTLTFEPLVGDNKSVTARALRLNEGADAYTVVYRNFETFKEFINSRGSSIQDGDLTDLYQRNALSIKTVLEVQEVTFFRKALLLIPGKYLFAFTGFFLVLDITTSVKMNIQCESVDGDTRRFEREFRELVDAGATNIKYAGGTNYINFIGEVAKTCSSIGMPADSTFFYVFSATDRFVYLGLGGRGDVARTIVFVG